MGANRDALLREAEAEAEEILDSISIHWAAVVGARETERGRGVLRFLYGRVVLSFHSVSPGSLWWLRGVAIGTALLGGALLFFESSGDLGLARALIFYGLVAALLLGLLGALPLPTATLRVMTLERLYRRTLLETTTRAWLIERFNRSKRSLDIQLSYMGKPRLADIDDPEQEISTSSRETFRRTLERMPGGAIGLAGLAASARAPDPVRSAQGARGATASGCLGAVVEAPVV